MRTDTAHISWNARWQSEEGRAAWVRPESDVVATAARLAATRHPIRALDHGCGVGRHALHFARLGFETRAVDLADTGLAELRRNAAAEGLTVIGDVAPMTALPFDDGHFDYVLSFNVIYHGDDAVVRAALAEIRRVLRPGGTFQATMLSKRNAGFGVGTEVAPNTFVRETPPDDPDDSDKHHPHFYCNAAELVTLLDGFELMSLADQEHDKPGTWHWHLVADRL